MATVWKLGVSASERAVEEFTRRPAAQAASPSSLRYLAKSANYPASRLPRSIRRGIEDPRQARTAVNATICADARMRPAQSRPTASTASTALTASTASISYGPDPQSVEQQAIARLNQRPVGQIDSPLLRKYLIRIEMKNAMLSAHEPTAPDDSRGSAGPYWLHTESPDHLGPSIAAASSGTASGETGAPAAQTSQTPEILPDLLRLSLPAAEVATNPGYVDIHASTPGNANATTQVRDLPRLRSASAELAQSAELSGSSKSVTSTETTESPQSTETEKLIEFTEYAEPDPSAIDIEVMHLAIVEPVAPEPISDAKAERPLQLLDVKITQSSTIKAAVHADSLTQACRKKPIVAPRFVNPPVQKHDGRAGKSFTAVLQMFQGYIDKKPTTTEGRFHLPAPTIYKFDQRFETCGRPTILTNGFYQVDRFGSAKQPLAFHIPPRAAIINRHPNRFRPAITTLPIREKNAPVLSIDEPRAEKSALRRVKAQIVETPIRMPGVVQSTRGTPAVKAIEFYPVTHTLPTPQLPHNTTQPNTGEPVRLEAVAAHADRIGVSLASAYMLPQKPVEAPAIFTREPLTLPRVQDEERAQKAGSSRRTSVRSDDSGKRSRNSVDMEWDYYETDVLRHHDAPESPPASPTGSPPESLYDTRGWSEQDYADVFSTSPIDWDDDGWSYDDMKNGAYTWQVKAARQEREGRAQLACQEIVVNQEA